MLEARSGRPARRSGVLASLSGAAPSRRQVASLAAAGSSFLALRLRKRLKLPAPLTTIWLFATPPAIAAGFKRSFVRDGVVWGAHMWAYKNAFELPTDRGQRHRQRAHIDYPIAIDSRIGGGIPPGTRLQRRLRTGGELTALDKALTFLYLTWEAEPHVAMMWLRRRHPERFASAAGRLAATFDLTLLGYWMVPTAPPWWASEKAGRMDEDVSRVMMEVIAWVKGEPHPTRGDHEMSTNTFAAMPSDHFASALMTAMILSESSPALGAFGWGYALLLGLSLLYLGEHYASDLLAGLSLALAVSRARRVPQGIAKAVLSLGPLSRPRMPRR